MSASEAAVGEAKPGLLQRYVPILGWLPTYRRDWFTPDAVAALSVWALLTPKASPTPASPWWRSRTQTIRVPSGPTSPSA